MTAVSAVRPFTPIKLYVGTRGEGESERERSDFSFRDQETQAKEARTLQPTHTELLRLVCPLCACLCLLHEGEHDICLVDELDILALWEEGSSS